MKTRARSVFLFWIITAVGMSSQVATGTPPFNSFGGGPFDTVNLGNLNVHFAIPVLNKAGRGMPFGYNLGNDNSIWTLVTSSGTTSWSPDSTWGWQVQTDAATGYLRVSSISMTTGNCTFPPGIQRPTPLSTVTYGGFVDRLGTFHHVPGLTNSEFCNGTNGVAYTGAAGTADDGSGYKVAISANLGPATVTARNGGTWNISPNSRSASATVADANGNQITTQVSGTQTTFFDTLSSTTPVLTVAGTAPNPVNYTYVAPSGANTSVAITYKSYTVQTSFQCTNIGEYGPTSNSLVDRVTLPDGTFYQFGYETTPISGSTNVTGRIASVKLPTGGTISYTYPGANDGINCSDGSTIGLTRTLNPGGEWQYARTQQTDSSKHWQTKITTPPDSENPASVGDDTVIDFQEDSSTATPASNYFFETQRQIYQGTGSGSAQPCSNTNTSNCLLMTTTTCYNANTTSCPTTAVSSQITRTDTYTQPAGGTPRLSIIFYNSYGLVYDQKEFDYGATKLIRETSTTYATLGNGIVNKPASVTVYDWSSAPRVTLASTSYTYDQGTPTPTTNTPQHIAISGARGNLTTLTTFITTSINGSTSLSKTFTYYDTGTPNVATDVNGAQTTYVYGTTSQGNSTISCGNSFPTTINEPLGLSRSTTWNCTGAVSTQVTDENGKNISSSYTDANFWRPFSVTDQMNSQSNVTYVGETAVETTLQNFNGGSSASDSRATADGFGRPIFSQRLQAPGSINYDTVETDYNNLGQRYRSTMPYTAVASPSSSNTTAPATTKTYDALGRVLTITDADGGKISYTYANNDVLQTVSGSQTFKKQLEYDGLGRLTSVCELSGTLPNIGSCGQNTTQNGYWTKYTYDALGRLLKVTQNAQASSGQQIRSFTYDMLGRVTSETNPETGSNATSGTITYTYDGGCSTTPVFCGNLTSKLDAAGNTTTYTYDLLHRVLTEGNSSISGATLRKFVYDSTSATPPSGWTAATSNPKTRMIEATTTNTSGNPITDEWFSYDARGELTDVYESTPHSNGFYHTTAAYWPTGTLKTLSGIPGVPTMNYGANGAGLDGRGRITQVTASSGTSPITGVTYSTGTSTAPLGALTGVTFGSADSDAFTYDPNTGRMATYTFTVNGKTDVGTLTWNSNGTLAKLVVNDQVPGTSDSQTCTYGYDDVKRVSTVNCGALWTQSFTYDAFGNITKSGSRAFAPSYTFTVNNNSVFTNQYFSIPNVSVQYDANGNLLTDNLNTYTWDPNWATMITVSSGATTVTATYDALGRMVENNAGGTWAEFVYGPTGAKLAKCNGQTLVKAFIALPGGAKAIYNSSGLAYFRHSDWLGTSRLTSTATKPTSMYSSSAYSPFGEQYATAGTADFSFTGQDQDTISSLYDFWARRQSPTQGRWISPDPAGLAAVAYTEPQSWNRYAYAMNNPLAIVDSDGLDIFCGTRTDFQHAGLLLEWPGGNPLTVHCVDSGGGGGGGGGGGSAGGGASGGGGTCTDPQVPCTLPVAPVCADASGTIVPCTSSDAAQIWTPGGCVTDDAAGGGTETSCTSGSWMSFQDFAASALATMLASGTNSWQNPDFGGQQLTPDAVAILSMVNGDFPSWMSSTAFFSHQTCLYLTLGASGQFGLAGATAEVPPVAGTLLFTGGVTTVVAGAGCEP